MSSRQFSHIWKYFIYDSSAEKARCNICKTELSQRRGSTSNLNRHMRLKHSNLKLLDLKRRNRPYPPRLQEETYIMEIQEEHADINELIVTDNGEAITKSGEVNSPILNAALLVPNSSQSLEAQTEGAEEITEVVFEHKPAVKRRRKKIILDMCDNYILPVQQKYHSVKSQTTWSGPDAIHEVLHQRNAELETLREMTQVLKTQAETMLSVQQTMLELKQCLVVQGEILQNMLDTQQLHKTPEDTAS